MTRWISLLLVLAGCEQLQDEPAPPPVADRLEFKMLTKERTVDGCIAGAEGCTYVRLDYPVLVDAPAGYNVTAVTEEIFSALTASWGEAEPYENVEALMQAFIVEYLALARDQPDHELPWFLERKVFVLHNTPDVLSLSLSERSFTGGAHAMAAVTFENLDPRTGETVTLADILVEGYEAKLLPIARARFREVREIEEGTSLADAGFTFFGDGEFTLTDNVAIGEDGLTFYYNPYEIAPYTLGPTEIVLSYDELDELLKE